MKAILAAAMTVSLSATALGNDAVASQALQCMSMLPGDFRLAPEIEMKISLDDRGQVGRIDVLGFSPNSPDGRRIAEAATLAVSRCAPYVGVEGTFLVVFQPAEPDGNDPAITFPVQ